jgi:hypothetical protein
MCARIGQYLPSSHLEAFFKIDPKFIENRGGLLKRARQLIAGSLVVHTKRGIL